MKGQYLALEATLTIALSIAIAIGTITFFVGLRDSVESSVTSKQAEVVKAQLRSGINKVKGADRGSVAVVLPEQIGGADYTASVSEESLVVSTGTESFESSSGQLGESYRLSGSSSGGTSTLSKTGNSIRLIPGG